MFEFCEWVCLQEDEVRAFVIDERTFYNLDDGTFLDDDLDEPAPSQGEKPAESAKPLVFDESVFNAEEELPDTDDEEEDEDGDDAPGSSGLQKADVESGQALQDRLKL